MNPRQFLAERRKRLVGAVLGYCEQADWYDELDRAEKEALRQKVLDCIAAFYDDVLDVMKALDGPETGVTNQLVFDLLHEIADDLRSQRPLPVTSTEVAGAGAG